jgi:HSP20 family molecular chaperone IbpA
MSRMTTLSSPFMLGFDQFERLLDRAAKLGNDGYPPYNIEKLQNDDEKGESLRITLAVAGFTKDDIEVTLEENQLVIKGRQKDDSEEHHYLHRGIATRQFQRSFVLADGIEIVGAGLKDGLLAIDLKRNEPERIVKTIAINSDIE